MSSPKTPLPSTPFIELQSKSEGITQQKDPNSVHWEETLATPWAGDGL